MTIPTAVTTAELVGLGAMTLVILAVAGKVTAALNGLFRAVRLLARLAWWVISRPRLSIPLAAASLLTWLAWPALEALHGVSGGGSSTALILIGIVGATLCALLVGPAIVQQHRLGRDLEADWGIGPVVDDDDTPTVAPPEWARE